MQGYEWVILGAGIVLGYLLLQAAWARPWGVFWLVARRIVAGSSATLLLLDDSGRILEASPLACRLFGIKAEAFKDRFFIDFIKPGPWGSEREVMAVLTGPGIPREKPLEFGAQSLEGCPLSLDAAVTAMPGAKGRAFMVNFRDHTQLKEARERLKGSENLYRTLVENLREMVLVMTPERKCLYVSPNVKQLMGWEPQEMLEGGTLAEKVHPEDHARLGMRTNDVIRAAMREPHRSHQHSYRVRCADGNYKMVEASYRYLPEGLPSAGEEAKKDCVLVTLQDISARHEAEKKLAEKERLYSAILEHSLDGVVLVDTNGLVRYRTSNVAKMSGFADEERLEKPVLDVLIPEDRAANFQAMQKALANPGVVVRSEGRVRIKSGQILRLELLVRFVSEGLGDPTLVVNFRDVSERKTAQEKLEASERFHRNLVTNLHEVVIVLDMKQRLRFVSPSIERVLGYKPEELLEKTGEGRLHPEDHPRMREFFMKVVASPGAAHALSYRSMHKDGNYRYLQAFLQYLPEGMPGLNEPCVMVTYHDISQRKEAEEKVEKSEKFYRSLMENSLDGISVIGTDGEVVYHSPSISRITGLDPEDRKGRSVFENIPSKERSRIQGFLEQARKEPGKTFDIEFRADNGKGQEKYFEALVQYNPEALGQAAFIVNYRDISERKATQKQMLRFERLATVGEMAAGLAHELRNPLLALSATAENLILENHLSLMQKADLGIILEQCRRMRDLLEGTLGASAERPPRLSPVPVQRAFAQALELARRHFGPSHTKVDVEMDFPEGLPPVMAEEARLQQVLLNLLLNAFQAMPEGGTMRLEAAVDGEGLKLSVKDSGTGLADPDLERVFEPFFSTKPNGSGIGLPISRRIVQAHGGRIRAERLKQGTAFHIWMAAAVKEGSPA